MHTPRRHSCLLRTVSLLSPATLAILTLLWILHAGEKRGAVRAVDFNSTAWLEQSRSSYAHTQLPNGRLAGLRGRERPKTAIYRSAILTSPPYCGRSGEFAISPRCVPRSPAGTFEIRNRGALGNLARIEASSIAGAACFEGVISFLDDANTMATSEVWPHIRACRRL